MKKIIIPIFKFFLSFIPLSLIFCSSNTLPLNMPQDLVITMKKNHGMRPISKTIYISIKKSYLQKHYNRVKQKFTFKTNKREINNLYKMLKQNRVSYITTHKMRVLDRGGTRLSLKWNKNKKRININNSGMYFINSAYKKNWTNILNGINKYLNSKLKPMRKNIIFIINDRLKIKHAVFIKLNDITVFTKKTSRKISDKVINKKILPEVYSLSIVITHKRKYAIKNLNVNLKRKTKFYITINNGKINNNIINIR